MILTGSEIIRERARGKIFISSFNDEQINPNSYNYRLGEEILVFDGYDGTRSLFKKIKLPSSGFTLKPHQTYLGITLEIIGSIKYAMSLIGRSSMGRLGLFLQLSANLGHTTSCHRWTLEIMASQPMKIYPGMIIGQVSFWANRGPITMYEGTYGSFDHPKESLLPIYDPYGQKNN